MVHLFTNTRLKILTTVFLVILFFPTVSLYAFSITLPTTDPLPPVPTADSAERTKNVGLTIAGITIPGVTLDGLASQYMRGMLTQLTNTTVNFINNGFHGTNGGPQYATDLEGYLKTAGDAVAGSIIQGTVPGLCTPFQNVVNIALKDAQNAVEQRNAQPITTSCKLSQVSNNIANFMDGDFIGEGGWDAWFTMTQDPYGNPYSEFLNVQATVDAKTAAALDIQNQQLSWNKGFLSTQSCVTPGPDGTCADYGPVKTPGDVIEAQLEKEFGSQVDQLNLSNDFNDILLALVGQLEKSVFSNVKGIFDSNPYQNTFAGGSGNNGGGFCTPSAETYVIGTKPGITWSFAGVPNGSATFTWQNGSLRDVDDGLNGTTTQSPQISYTTEGVKNAMVTVSQSLDGGVSTTTQKTTCTGQVTVSKYPPVRIASCQVLDATGSALPLRVKPRSIAYFFVSFAGGSGSLNKVDMKEGALLDVSKDNHYDDLSKTNQLLGFATGAFAAATNPVALFETGGSLTLFPFLVRSVGGYDDARFWITGEPLPLIKSPAPSNTIDLLYKVNFTHNGSYSLGFDRVSDTDPNVPILENVSCPQTITVDDE